jgi:hypothetical protein
MNGPELPVDVATCFVAAFCRADALLAPQLEWIGPLTRAGEGGIDEMLWRHTPLWAAGLEFCSPAKSSNVVPFPLR